MMRPHCYDYLNITKSRTESPGVREVKGGHVSHVLSPECQVELAQEDTDGADVDDGGPAVVVEYRDVQGGQGAEGEDEQLEASRQP